MATRNVFNRFSTIAEKLNYLNKQKLDDFSETYDDSNIAQTLSFSESVSATQTYEVATSQSQAYFYNSTVVNSDGYSNELTVSSLESILKDICHMYIINNIDIELDGDLVTTTVANPQSLYVDSEGLELAYIYSSNGINYYRISSGEYVADGNYDFFVTFTSHTISSTTFSINKEIYFENNQEVFGYANLLTD